MCVYEIYEISVHIFLYEKFKNIPDITTVKMMVGKIINTVVWMHILSSPQISRNRKIILIQQPSITTKDGIVGLESI